MRILLHCNADLSRACPRQLKILVGLLLLPQRGERPVKLRLGKICRRLLQDLVGGVQFLDLALQLLDPGLVGTAPALSNSYG